MIAATLKNRMKLLIFEEVLYLGEGFENYFIFPQPFYKNLDINMNAVEPKLFTKVDIINTLAKVNGWHSYLEFCTPTTGNLFRGIDRSQLSTCHRLMYNCPSSYDDQMNLNFRSESFEVSDCITAINHKSLRYNIILVDSWHEYHTSYRDLSCCFDLLTPDGIMIVHDCLPLSESMAHPLCQVGEWCGVTYKAYIDFILAHDHRLNYFTVDIDYGCGVITRLNHGRALQKYFKATLQHLLQNSGKIKLFEEQKRLVNIWHNVGADYNETFALLQRHTKSLLNLISYQDFIERVVKI